MIYKLLFLDIETNGLSPNNDEILEIAGVFCKYSTEKTEIIDHFQSLIRPQQSVNEITSQITGLTDSSFIDAPNSSSVHDLWANFIDKNYDPVTEKLVIIGHSIIEFDILFLIKNNYFLPEKYDLADTFYLSKILFPQFTAVNLEALITNFDLNNRVEKLIKDFKIDAISHRALYDTLCCYSLWFDILNFINLYNYSPKIKTIFIEELLHIPLYNLQEKVVIPLKNNEINDTTTVYIDWKGKTKSQNPIQLIQTFSTEIQNSIIDELTNKFPKNYTALYLQLYTILIAKKHFINYDFYFHGRRLDHLKATIILKSLHNSDIITNNNLIKKTPLLETLIWQADEINTTKLDFEELIVLLELVLEIANNDKINKQIQLTINAYDFFKLSLNPFWINNHYSYKPKTIKLTEENIYHKLHSVAIEINNLSTLLNKETDTITSQLKRWISNNTINFEEEADFTMIKDYVKILYKANNPNIINSLNTFLQTENISIPTFFTKNEAIEYINYLNLEPISKEFLNKIEFFENPENDSSKPIKKFNVTRVNGNLEITSQSLELLICTNNKLFLKTVEYIGNHCNREDWIAIGQSGSITKIMSKLRNGFNGIVILRQNDSWAIKKLDIKTKDNIMNIKILGDFQFYPARIFFSLMDKYKLTKLVQILNNAQIRQLEFSYSSSN
jgi:DNA polymerase III epsilon subunit-like protein